MIPSRSIFLSVPHRGVQGNEKNAALVEGGFDMPAKRRGYTPIACFLSAVSFISFRLGFPPRFPLSICERTDA
jgi:hypothetical protein